MKFRINENFIYILTYLIIVWVFCNWIISPVNIGGDFNFVNYDHFKVYSSHPFIWDYSLNNGFGQVTLFTLPFFYYAFILNTLTGFITNPFLLHKIIFLFPLLIITTLSITILAHQLISSRWGSATAILLYIVNPYFMMLTSGGQMGVAFAYGFTPLVLAIYLKTLQIQQSEYQWSHKIKWYLISSLSAAILISFDSRLAILVLATIIAAYLAILIINRENKKLLLSYLLQMLITGIVIVGFHAFWLVPSVFVQSVALPPGYATTQAVEFFSFGRFAHTLTWTHPNYPDNLFGVVKEVSGLAVIFPLLAFWTIKKPTKKTLYFSGIALVSAFLAKGTSEPFGTLYSWAFQHIPTFSWFRDSTKFFLSLSLAYALLIGSTIAGLEKSNASRSAKTILIVITIACVGYVWSPTGIHSIDGTLAYRTYPAEFQKIEKTLQKDTSFGRVLWIPSREMYGYYDSNHPAVALQELRSEPTCMPTLCLPASAVTAKATNKPAPFTKQDLLNQIDNQLRFLDDPQTEQKFQELAIKYVIVTPDYDHTLYLYDRKYDSEVKKRYENKIENIPWLTPRETSNSILKTTRQKGALLTETVTGDAVSYKMINPTVYSVTIKNPEEPVQFAQQFDPHWTMIQGGTNVTPQATELSMMQFVTTKLHPGEAMLVFKGQEYADQGWIISILTILSSLACIGYLHYRGGTQ